MEQVLPGADPDDPDSDPITESNEAKDAGDPATAHRMLMKLCEADLRCVGAHALQTKCGICRLGLTRACDVVIMTTCLGAPWSEHVN